MKFVGLLVMLLGLGAIVHLGSQDGTDIVQVSNILVGQAMGAMAACVGGVMFAH